MKSPFKILIILLLFSFSCSKDNLNNAEAKNATIFFFNDAHGQLDNFSKIKKIVDDERKNTNVIVACSGDVFSGNPAVDNSTDKGYPMIDMMNKIGVDVAELGNHEFDYGVSVLKERIEQSQFKWICANIDMEDTGIPEPPQYYTVDINGMKVTFLGLLETTGKPGATIPSTHPWKVEDISFQRPENEAGRFSSVKSVAKSDLLVGLTHLGSHGFNNYLGDFDLANNFPFFDLIIGGHSHEIVDTVVNNIPVFQAGSYLNYLGKIELSVKNKTINSVNFELIDLNSYNNYDAELKSDIDDYNNLPYLNDVIGYSHGYLSPSEVGCFYTDALRLKMNVDAAFQNTGGVRSGLNAGDITKREIFEIAPFNNGTVIYEITVSDIKNFLIGSGSGFYYSGIQILKSGNNVIIKDLNGNTIPDDYVLTVGLNDYIPAVYDSYFPSNGNRQLLTAAETLITYLEEINDQVDYQDCNHYFRY
jgi:5'-nucleotidase / UDP-sugar diphosphatase